jgi:hypothetical protein
MKQLFRVGRFEGDAEVLEIIQNVFPPALLDFGANRRIEFDVGKRFLSLYQYQQFHVHDVGRIAEAAKNAQRAGLRPAPGVADPQSEGARRSSEGDGDAETASRGKGSHQTLYYGTAFTIIRNSKDELKTGTYHAMCRQLGVKPGDLWEAHPL